MNADPGPTPAADGKRVKGRPSRPTHLLQLIAEATANYRSAEAIIQQRLNNFLMAESILLLASAAIVTTTSTSGRQLLVLVVSGLGAALGFGWTLLGLRQKVFLDLHMEILLRLEARFEDRLWRVNEPIGDLRDGKKEVTFPLSGREVKLSHWELKFRSSNLVALVPLAFFVAFLMLFGVGVRGWS